MHYDPATLGLWLPLGATVIVGVIQTAGWRHKAVIYGGTAIGVACIVAAVLSPFLAVGLPWLTNTMASIAASPSSWFTLAMFVAALVLFSPPRRRKGNTIVPPNERGEDSAQVKAFKDALKATNTRFDSWKDELCERIQSSTDYRGKQDKAIFEAIEIIKGQIKIDLPNASTVAEAYHNLDQAVESKIARISEEIQGFYDSQRTAGADLLVLLDLAVYRATASTMRGLLSERPVYDKMAPPEDSKIRWQQIDDVRHWLATVSSVTATAAYGQEIHIAVASSKSNAESDARQVPPDQRPPIDALVFHDFYVAAHRSDSVGSCLEYVIRQVEKNERQALDRLRQALAARQKR